MTATPTTTIKWNWPLLASVCTALAGVAGTVLTPIYGTQLSGAVQDLLQALSGLLVLIPTTHAASAALSRSNAVWQAAFAREQAALDRPPPGPETYGHTYVLPSTGSAPVAMSGAAAVAPRTVPEAGQ